MQYRLVATGSFSELDGSRRSVGDGELASRRKWPVAVTVKSRMTPGFGGIRSLHRQIMNQWVLLVHDLGVRTSTGMTISEAGPHGAWPIFAVMPISRNHACSTMRLPAYNDNNQRKTRTKLKPGCLLVAHAQVVWIWDGDWLVAAS